uniref:Uncharacterized protein n=1 Tax=Mycena chlorophos TaxID=658473 RepID=A0ABQ0ME07_MYCCL|nr:predicted protein [Mycena chlorophos]
MLARLNALLLLSAALLVRAAPQNGDPPPSEPVFTATRVYETLVSTPPYFVTLTTMITWTESPSTSIANPTGTPVTSVAWKRDE